MWVDDNICFLKKMYPLSVLERIPTQSGGSADTRGQVQAALGVFISSSYACAMKKFSSLVLILCAACGGASTTDALAEGGHIAGSEVPTAEAVETPDMSVETGSIAAAIASPLRSEEHRARDAFRHPAETLSFFGITPQMRVVEVWPGGGWYTEILAPVLRDHGTLIAAGYDLADPGRHGDYERSYREKLAEHPVVYNQIEHVIFDSDHLMVDVPDASVDAVLVIRAVHNMVRDGDNVSAYFASMARVLKPGGVLGIVQHRMPEGLDVPNDGTAGYLTKAAVVGYAEAAGLTLQESSDINANPRDTHVHAEGVWSMPPSLRGGDESLAGLGESDRMTLRFVKPAVAAE